MNNNQKNEYDIQEYDIIEFDKINIFNDNDLELCPWVLKEEKNNKTVFKILCPILADYIRHNCYYLFVRNRVKESVQRFFYHDGVYKQVDDFELKGYIKNFIPLSLQKIRDVNEVLQLLYTDLVYVKDVDLNPTHIINFKNGILNLKTWELEQHSPKYKSTIQIPCDYNSNVEKPNNSIFDNYLNHLTYNKKDRRKLLLQFMGVALSNVPGYLMKAGLFMVGEHNTGKTQIKELCTKLIGEEYCSTADLQTLEGKFGTSNLYNTRLVGSNDMSYIKVHEMNIFKQATGGDTLSIEYKNENTFNYKYKGVLWFCCNKLPKFGGDKGDGVYERILTIECNNPVPIKNKTLLDEMYQEKEYIVNLAIEELRNVINNGYEYNIPEDCIYLNKQYRIENDSFLSFIEECVISRISGKLDDGITCAEFHKIYKKWCNDNNNGYSIEKKECNKILESKNLSAIKKCNGIRYFTDITINPDIIKEYNTYFTF